MSVFRVRFHQEHTPGYHPAKIVDDVSAALYKLLKRQRMVLSHTDEAGFACYVPVTITPKRMRVKKPCARCGYSEARP